MLTKKLPAPANVQTEKNDFPSLHTKPTGQLTLFALLIALFLSGCIKELPDCDTPNRYLVSSSKIG